MWKKVKQNGMAIIAPAVLAPAIGAVLRIVTMSDVGRVLTIPAGFCVGLVVTTVFLLIAVPLQNRMSSKRSRRHPRRHSQRFRAKEGVGLVFITAIAAIPGALFGLSLAVFIQIIDATLHLVMPSPFYWIASGAVYGVIWGGCVLATLVLVALLSERRRPSPQSQSGPD